MTDISENLLFILNDLEFSLNERLKSINDIDNCVNITNSEKIIYHYTNLEGLQNIIINKSLFFSNSIFLNDSQELVKGKNVFEKSIDKLIDKKPDSQKILEKIKQKISDKKNSEKYVACFSTKGDLLSRWRAYSNDGKGICIGFDLNKLIEIFNFANRFNIVYDEKIQAKQASILITECLDFYLEKERLFAELLPNYSKEDFINLVSEEIYNQISKYLGQFKHNTFEEENEFRFEISIDSDFKNSKSDQHGNERDISYRCGRNNLFVPYIDVSIQEIIKETLFPIKKVIIDPSLNSDLNEISITNFLQKSGYNTKKIKIKKSKVPYRI